MSETKITDPAQRRQKIFDISLPIIGGMVSQNVLNLVDTAMVGALGNQALAAVGLGGFMNWMAMAFITGLGTGVQTLAARRYGEGKRGETAVPLNGGLLLAFGLAFPWSILMFFLAPFIFPMMNPDPEVVALGIPYLQARLVGMVAVAMNFSFRGYWNGVNLSRLYMRTLIVMHISNVIISYGLIFGVMGLPELGSTGAGVGTALSTYIGMGMYVFLGFRHAREGGFFKRLPSAKAFKTILKVSVPAAMQQLFFAAGMTAFFWIVGQVGTKELAASNVLINLLLVAILPGMAFGMASASLVGQALGRKDPEDAAQWGWDVSKIAMLAVGGVALPAVFVPDLLLGFFIHDAETLAMARWPLRIVAVTIAWDTMGSVLMNSLFGAGDSGSVMKVSVGLQWGLYLPLLFVLNATLGLTLLSIWVIQVAYRGLQTLIFVGMWKAGKWKSIKV